MKPSPKKSELLSSTAFNRAAFAVNGAHRNAAISNLPPAVVAEMQKPLPAAFLKAKKG